MPYVKSTVHLTRLAGAALKSFTHGYAQTVVAASQNSNLPQNSTSLYDSVLGRVRKAERSRLLHVQDGARHISTSSADPTAKPEAVFQDLGLDKYFDAWHKHQRSGASEWQQFQFAKRIEWQPPSVVPSAVQEAEVAHEWDLGHDVEKDGPFAAPSLKRSYTTSALDNFGKAFTNDEEGEAVALEQVNNAIAEEIQRSKDDSDDGILLQTRSVGSSSLIEDPSASDQLSVSPLTSLSTPTDSIYASPESDSHTVEIISLAEKHRYADIPPAFERMLHAGVQRPSPAAYHALLTSALELTQGKHQKVPRALEVYSDMLRRKVIPDSNTFSTLVELLACRTSEVRTLRTSLETRLARYGGLEKPGKFMFSSSQSEHTMLLEDSSFSLAMKLFDRAIQFGADTLSTESCSALIKACAEQGKLADMARVHQHMQANGMKPQSSIYPPMIIAFGTIGDLRSAVELYDQYKDLAIAHNAGLNKLHRNDNDIYAALIKAYGSADRLKGGLKFLSSVQAGISNPDQLASMRDVVVLQALLPLALKDETFHDAFDLAGSLTSSAHLTALANITTTAADKNAPDVSLKAFDTLSQLTHELVEPATAILAMHVRNANVEAAEPFWRVIEAAPASLTLVEPTTMRAVALISIGQAERALRQSRRMFSRIRDQQSEPNMAETVEHIDESIELLGSFLLKSLTPPQPEVSAELLRMMSENGGIIAPIAEHLVARLGPEQISRLSTADIELLTRVQAGMILDDSSADLAGPARFGCLLETITARSMMPSSETETLIERTLINIDRSDLSRLWKNYRYPPSPAAFTPAAFTPIVPYQPPAPAFPSFDDSVDPYAPRPDVKGSNAINDLLDSPRGRKMNEVMTKFRNMRRVGRVPRMFTYGKLIEGAAKENNMNLAHDILEMAKQDVPYDARYRVVRYGWQQILDHMVAACLTVNRRDMAARYHQDLLDMGAAPSANTFGLYITTMKENTKTFDEASEAVKIFLRAKAEGVEPTSFLYNALIGKLGKARRIDDCLFYFAEMRNLGIRPTSVTYGTVVNALCRVSDEKFAEEIFEEMESCSNYKPRPAPYHSLMQFFLTTKRDRGKVLAYYERMRGKGIEPTVHTYKLLIDTHATLEPINMAAAESVLADMASARVEPEAVHYASLIHAKGCVLHDIDGARRLFDDVASQGRVKLLPCMYQALFESLNANHQVSESDALLDDMALRNIEFTPYIANALIHGWTLEKNVSKAKEAFERVRKDKREPSTYEAMVRAYLAADDRIAAKGVIREALSRGYPSAVAGKIAELVR